MIKRLRLNTQKVENKIPVVIQEILLDKSAMLAGGAARSLMTNERINDFDLFFVSEHGLKETKEYLEYQKFKLVFSCPKGELFTYKKYGLKIQLINKRYYNGYYDLLNSFDFNCCMFVLDLNDDGPIGINSYIFTTNDAIIDSRNKEVNINRIEYPVATISRFIKYSKKGWTITRKAKEDICFALQNMSLNSENMILYLD
tara:strand:+ start:852 stop:1451 length:600 start_codon:yes stop_codon:yes gene_type:complete